MATALYRANSKLTLTLRTRPSRTPRTRPARGRSTRVRPRSGRFGKATRRAPGAATRDGTGRGGANSPPGRREAGWTAAHGLRVVYVPLVASARRTVATFASPTRPMRLPRSRTWAGTRYGVPRGRG